ncbi:MAG: hypothetical protein P4N59_31535 [Negativicutes bacterium]|nr:hypothetical protein [Negativicutes bacterium]
MFEHCQESYDGNGCRLSEGAVKLRDRFRLLWEQHVYWTRLAILGIAFDLPDLDASINRLLRNPTDFGRLFCRFYGNEMAAEVDRLLRDHLVIAAELVKAAKAGNSKAAADSERKWYANADEIVFFLNQINPRWTVHSMRASWYEHLALTKEEAVAILSKDNTKSVAMFNQIEKEAMMMADDFSGGMICQFGL